MPTTAAQQSDAENIRLVIAKQPTIAGSVQALLRAVCGVAGNALEKGDPDALQAFVDHINADPKSWSDAVMANTPLAQETVMPIIGVPPEIEDAFRSHAAAHVEAGEQGGARHAGQQGENKGAQQGRQEPHQDKR